MTLANNKAPVVDRLEFAIGKGRFPKQYDQWANQLLSHLRKPVQIAVMGMHESGKSTLINMMLGDQIVSQLKGVPVIEVAHGPSVRTLFEIEDGAVIRRNGLISDEPAPANTVRARFEMPMPELLRQTYVEVGLAGDFGHQRSLVHWATQFADIILWCTEEFNDIEQKLWSKVPDEIKDHSFLVLTMADRQMMKGTLSQNIADLQSSVADEFLGLYPIATIQANAARDSNAKDKNGLWKSSGGMALVDSLTVQIENGRSADIDQARMLLNRFAQSDAVLPAEQGVAEQTVVEPQATKVIAISNTVSEGEGDLTQETQNIMSDALIMLQESAEQMLGTLNDDDRPDFEGILDKCVETAKSLTHVLMDANPADPVVKETQDDVLESEEMLLLFRLEKGEEAAADAVTLLLQLKKEIADKA